MQGGCGPVVRSVNREEALLVHSGTSAEALRSVSSLLVEVEELEAPLFGVEAPARGQRCLARDLGEVLVQEHAGELLPGGDAELLVVRETRGPVNLARAQLLATRAHRGQRQPTVSR